jgi:hypothetical protein
MPGTTLRISNRAAKKLRNAAARHANATRKNKNKNKNKNKKNK